jgi:dTDP-4-amino-4,6-dideoxygalactose transaminase
MRIPMTDLKAQYVAMKDEIDAAVERVIGSGRYILGPEVEAFEKEMAIYCGTGFATGVASGSDALVLGLIACGIAQGDEVITTPFTFIATAMAITRIGAVPVFADIDPLTYNIDPDRVESRITPRTRAILPVHLFGQPANMDAILRLGRKYGLKIIEDCAQSLGAKYGAMKTGSLGDIGCFSFFPSKNLGAYGDGGMITTNNAGIAETLKMLRQHGAKNSYYHVIPGFNSRLDALQAAVLRVKLKYIDRWRSMRQDKIRLYNELLEGIPGIRTPNIDGLNVSSANYYTIRLGENIDRDGLRRFLASKGIETNIYYPLSLHLQEVYRSLGYRKGDLPESEKAQEQVVALPLYPELGDGDVREVAGEIREFCLAGVSSGG